MIERRAAAPARAAGSSKATSTSTCSAPQAVARGASRLACRASLGPRGRWSAPEEEQLSSEPRRYSSMASASGDESLEEQQLQEQRLYSQGGLPNGSRRLTPRPAVSIPAVTRVQPPAPQPVPIIHSSAYQQTLVQTRTMSPSIMNSDDEDIGPMQGLPSSSTALAPPTTSTGTVIVRSGKRAVMRPGAAGSPEPFQGSALEWALHKADASLDELEDNPMPLQKAVYDISRGPVGTATSSAVQAAAQLTMKGAVEVAKIAAPIGKWALQEGAKAAAGLITRALIESVKSPNNKNNKSGKSGDSSSSNNNGSGTMLLRKRTPSPAPSGKQQQAQQRKGGKGGW